MGKVVFQGIGILIAGFVTAAFLVIYKAMIAAYLWAWFVVPLGLPTISTAWMYGLILLIQLITYDPSATRKKGEWFETLFGAFFGWNIVWLIGYLVHDYIDFASAMAVTP